MRRIAIAAVMALLALLILPGSASAWDQIPCDSGALRADAAVAKEGKVRIPGMVECGVTQSGAKFVVAVFVFGNNYGYYDPFLMRAYASPTGPTNFIVVGFVEQPTLTVDTGLCIMPDEDTRLSCVQVAPDLTVTPLSTKDSRVTVRIIDKTQDSTPACATCFFMEP